MKKLMLLAATLIVAAIALSAPRATNAQTVSGYQIPYYLNIPTTKSVQSNVSSFNCYIIKPQYGNGTLGRFIYQDKDGNNIFSGETLLIDISSTSVVAYFHTPVISDFLAYTIMNLNVNNGVATVNLTKVDRFGNILWATSFNLNSGPIVINPMPNSN